MAITYIDKVTQNKIAFEKRVIEIATNLGIKADWLMVVMWAESKLNHLASNPNSSAFGLIQFMDSTMVSLGTNRYALATMSNVKQLDYVEKYFISIGKKGKMNNIYDVYFAVFYPRFVGAADGVLFPQSVYNANKGMDISKDGKLSVLDVKKWFAKYIPVGMSITPTMAASTATVTAIGGALILYNLLK